MKKGHISDRSVFLRGMRDGIPIGLGYLAVSFALGIPARNAGLSPFQGFVMSILGLASAGEFAAITVIAAGAPYLEMAAASLITNARYILMSFALSQRLSPDTGVGHRLLLGYGVTDELFGIAISYPAPLNPLYSYGAVLVAAPLWAIGTAAGIMAGNLLPVRAVSALGVALYGMFLAVIIPPAKKDHRVLVIVVLSFLASYASEILPWISGLYGSTRIILLTIVLAGLAALVFPVREPDPVQDSEADPITGSASDSGKEPDTHA